MKSAHRHQLETNVLADWVGHKLQELEPYKNFIAIGFVVVLAIILVAVFSAPGDNPATAAQWSAYYSAFGLDDAVPALETLADSKDNANSPAALWAKKALADQSLASGCQLLFGNPKDAREKLTKAEDMYTAVIDGSTQPLLKNTARIGLGRTLESLDRGDEARKTYEAVVASDKDSALSKFAKEGLDRLDNPRVISALAWVMEQKPSLPVGHPPLGGLPGLNAPLPDRPDLSFPSSSLNSDGTAKPEAPMPKPEESVPAEEPKTEEPKTEEPKTEEPKTEEPKTEEPKTEEPKTEEPKTEEPKAEEPKAEEPKAEEPVPAEDPKADATPESNE